MPTYATPADVAEYMTGDRASAPLSNAAPLIRHASRLVLKATRAAVYRINPTTELPLDPKLVATFREAVCAQVEAWASNDIDPAKGRSQVKPAVASKSAGGLSVSYTQDQAAALQRSDLASGNILVPAAWDILSDGGLLSTNLQAPGAWWGRAYVRAGAETPSTTFIAAAATTAPPASVTWITGQ
jgi:hypothetical protein